MRWRYSLYSWGIRITPRGVDEHPLSLFIVIIGVLNIYEEKLEALSTIMVKNQQNQQKQQEYQGKKQLSKVRDACGGCQSSGKAKESHGTAKPRVSRGCQREKMAKGTCAGLKWRNQGARSDYWRPAT